MHADVTNKTLELAWPEPREMAFAHWSQVAKLPSMGQTPTVLDSHGLCKLPRAFTPSQVGRVYAVGIF